MDEAFLSLIDAAFSETMRSYGFTVTLRPGKPPYNFAAASYENAGRTVAVTYAYTREQWCEVTIGGYGDPHPTYGLFAFVNGPDGDAEGYVSTNKPDVFAREAERCCALLVSYCEEFLRGDIPAFRRRYRELFLTAAVRGALYNAAVTTGSHWKEYEMYRGWLRDYWTDTDAQQDAFHADVRRRFPQE
jgi:hypothetical protein